MHNKFLLKITFSSFEQFVKACLPTFFIVDGTHDTYEEMDFVHMGDYPVKRGKYGFPYSVKAEIFEKNFHFEGWDMT